MKSFLLPTFIMAVILTAHKLEGQVDPSQSFTFTYANDYFKATDYYFTQGLDFAYRRGDLTVSIIQQGYTPTSISADSIRRGDRPYAGALFIEIAQKRRLVKSKAYWQFGLSAGVLGKASLAEAEQKLIHRLIDDEQPMGWQYQIADVAILNFQALFVQPVYATRWLNVQGLAEIRAGTYRSRLSTGAHLETGLLRPHHPEKLRLSLSLDPSTHLVLHDATLQGGLFNDDSPYTLSYAEITPIMGQIEVGLNLAYRKFGFSFSHNYISREFDSGLAHAWGIVRLRFGESQPYQ